MASKNLFSVMFLAMACSEGLTSPSEEVPMKGASAESPQAVVPSTSGDSRAGSEAELLHFSDGSRYYVLDVVARTLSTGGSEAIVLTDEQASVLMGEFRGFNRTDTLTAAVRGLEPGCGSGGQCAEARSPEPVPNGTPPELALIRAAVSPAKTVGAIVRETRDKLLFGRIRVVRRKRDGGPRMLAENNSALVTDCVPETFSNSSSTATDPDCNEIKQMLFFASEHVQSSRVTFGSMLQYLWDNKEAYIAGGAAGSLRFSIPSSFWAATQASATAAENAVDRLALDVLAWVANTRGCWSNAWTITPGGVGLPGWEYQCTEEFTEIWLDGVMLWSGYAKHCEFVATT